MASVTRDELVVAFTVDLEPDCPPFLQGYRGMEQGAPALLDLLDAECVPATFFTTRVGIRPRSSAWCRMDTSSRVTE
jgi:peptidoglycan/xylan/chitin deacetylase (PgdA/CDA1 family)